MRLRRMFSISIMTAALVSGGCVASDSSNKAKSDAETVEDAGDFILTYEEPAAADAATAELVESSGVVEEAVDGLNEEFALPADIAVVFAAGDEEGTGPYFDPEVNEVVMPYPYLTADRDLFKGVGYETEEEIDDAVVADLLFTLYHEFGHALIANLDLPITGREEDSVDALAAVILNDTYEDGQDIVLSAADWFAAASDARAEEYGFSDFADEHSLDDQRYVTLLCLVYGSDPDGHEDLIDPALLPEERADGCEAEYEQASRSWTALLEPYAL